tara:strand:- start:1183 stop:2346 length:1164 start_codon:yes stop_codon:yes gene_type:complete
MSCDRAPLPEITFDYVHTGRGVEISVYPLKRRKEYENLKPHTRKLWWKPKEDKNLIYKTEHITSSTGSKTVVTRLYCRNGSRRFVIMMKNQETPSRTRQRGLVHEKQMYRISNYLVALRICPFLLRSYDIATPRSVLLTESFDPRNYMTLRAFVHDERKDWPKSITRWMTKSERVARQLLVQLLWAIEVYYRIGMRHNDLHLQNVLISFCTPRDRILNYISRRGKQHVIILKRCPIMLTIFDNDRVIKANAPNLKNSKLAPATSPGPVTNLFPWHDPMLKTERLDLFKVLQELRKTATHKGELYKLLKNLCVQGRCATMSSKGENRMTRIYKANNFRQYHMLLNDNRREFHIPQWIGTAESYLLEIAAPFVTESKNGPFFADLANLY